MNWILIVVILALVVLIGWQEWNNRKERAKFINAIIGKNAQEVASMDLADKTQIKSTPVKSDIIPMENLSDEDWAKALKKNG